MNPRWRKTMAWLSSLLTLGALILGAGCRTTAPALGPVDLESGGWEVAEVPAVWRPRRGAPELTGELLLARAPSGDRLVQFSKQGLPVVSALVRSNRWQITSSLQPGRYTGRLPLRRAVLWLMLERLPPNSPAASRAAAGGWRLVPGSAATSWLLTNSVSGETLEGFGPTP